MPKGYPKGLFRIKSTLYSKDAEFRGESEYGFLHPSSRTKNCFQIPRCQAKHSRLHTQKSWNFLFQPMAMFVLSRSCISERWFQKLLCKPFLCNLKALNINKKPSPLRQRPGDVGKLVSNSVIKLVVMVWCSYCSFFFLYAFIWLQHSFIKIILLIPKW